MKMTKENANFVALLFVWFVAGITSTGCVYTEYAAYGLADVAYTHRLQSAIRSNSPEWYQNGMQLFAYEYNGHEWKKRTLTWAIGKESKRVDLIRLVPAAERAFKQWTDVTPFWFRRVSIRDKPDITISFENYDGTEKERVLCDIEFPKSKYLDDDGVTFIINDAWSWTNVPWCKDVYNLNFALLYLVSCCLGLDHTTNPDAVMSTERLRFDLGINYDLQRDDIIGIQRLYRFPELQDPPPAPSSSNTRPLAPPLSSNTPPPGPSSSKYPSRRPPSSTFPPPRPSPPNFPPPRPVSPNFPFLVSSTPNLPSFRPSASSPSPPGPSSLYPSPPGPSSLYPSPPGPSSSSNPSPPGPSSSTPRRIRSLSWRLPPPQ